MKVLAARYGIRLTNNTPVYTKPQEEAPAETAGELYESADAAEELPDEPFTDGSDT